MGAQQLMQRRIVILSSTSMHGRPSVAWIMLRARRSCWLKATDRPQLPLDPPIVGTVDPQMQQTTTDTFVAASSGEPFAAPGSRGAAASGAGRASFPRRTRGASF